ncbi:MAG: hypothetical protein ACLFVQ_14085 [Chitinispirillaceae bacterium]
MKLKNCLILTFLLTFSVLAQFPRDLALGPSLNASYAKGFQMIRMLGRFHMPGEVSDFEADLVTLSVLPERHLFERFGISWTSLAWLPPALLKNQFEFLSTPTVVLMGVNTVLNPSISFGNSWIRGTAGWKNDIFIFKDVLWVFEPFAGCKFSLPENAISNSSVSCGVGFPALVSSERELFKDVKNFRPKLFVEVSVFGFYPEVSLEAE